MKIAFCADVHMQGGPLLDVIAPAWRDMFAACKLRGVNRVVVAGDMFEDPNLAFGRAHTAGDVVSAVVEPILANEIETIILKGNHDDMTGHESALACLRGIPEITVVETSKILSLDDGRVQLACLPWEWNAELNSQPEMRELTHEQFQATATDVRRKRLAAIQQHWKGAGYRILTGHAEINGARNRYREIPDGSTHVFQMADLESTCADVLAFGHYHKRQMAYVGALVQLNHGEEGNPTGFLVVDTETGTKEWVDVKCPRYFTVSTEEFETFADALARQDTVVMPGWAFLDPSERRIKVRGTRPPVVDALKEAFGTDTLPPYVQFEPVIAPETGRMRTDRPVTAETSVPDLLDTWMEATAVAYADDFKREALAFYNQMLTEGLTVAQAQDYGLKSIDRIRAIHLRNIGPHEDTRLELPDGLSAIVGHTGAGKTFVLEAPIAALWGFFPYYPGPIADCIRDGFIGEASIDVKFEVGGETYRALRKIRKTAKTKPMESFLFRVETADIVHVHDAINEVTNGEACAPDNPVCRTHDRIAEKQIAGPREKDFDMAIAGLLGPASRLTATTFQNQDDAGSIISLDEEKRMEFARQWVGADRFDKAHEFVDVRRRRLSDTLVADQARLAALSGVNDRIAHLTGELDQAVSDLLAAEASQDQVRRSVETLVQVLTQIEQWRAAVRIWETDLESKKQAGLRQRGLVERLAANITANEAQLASEPQVRAIVEQGAALREEAGRRQRAREERSAALARVAQIDAEVARREGEMRLALVQAQGEYDKQDTALVTERFHIERQIEEKERWMREALRGMDAELERIHQGQESLARAGCAPQGYLPCPFIDHARSLDPVPTARARNEMCEKLEQRTFAPDLFEALQRVEAAIEERKYVVRPDTPALPPELAALLEQRQQIQVPLETPPDNFDAQFAALAEAEKTLARLAELLLQVTNAKAHAEMEAADLKTLQEQYRAALAARPSLTSYVSQPVHAGGIEALNPGNEDELERQMREDYTRGTSTLHSMQAEMQRLAAARGALEERLRAAVADADAARELIRKVEQGMRALEVAQALVLFFSPKGVPQLLIDTAIPRINEILADLMHDATEEPMVISLSTEREQKNAKMREGLFIWVTDSSGRRAVTRHSGGERNLVRKMLRIGIGTFEAERRGSYHRIYCVDEPTIGLDVQRLIPRMLNTIYRLTSRFNQVVVVDHNPALLVGIPTQFELSKVNGVTNVRRVG